MCHKRQVKKCIINISSNHELEEVDIRNITYYYFDVTIKIEDFNLDNIVIDKNSYENIRFITFHVEM